MNAEINNIINPLFGQEYCRSKVGYMKSLSIGFGKKIYHNNPRLNDEYYGEWEIGTYYCSWRILHENKILCASNDSDEKELDKEVKKISLGKITQITNLSSIDLRINFNTGICIDFLATISDKDEYFHIFCPGNICIEFGSDRKWKKSISNKPLVE